MKPENTDKKIWTRHYSSLDSGAVYRRLDKKLSDIVSVKDFGAVGDDSTDNTTFITNWLNAIMGGATGYVPAGTYQMDPVAISTMTGDIHIVCDRNAVFKYWSATASPLFSFTHTTRDTYGLSWEGGIIDNSGGSYSPSSQSNTCIELDSLSNVDISKVYFRGESTYAAAATTTTGTDSGVTTVDCKRVNIDKCWFRGQGDAGVYFSGGSSQASDADDGGECNVTNCHFWQCDSIITVKRNVRGGEISGNTARDCRVGVTALEANSVDPGRLFKIHANSFKRIETRAVEVRSQDGFSICDNEIEDFGYESDGTTISSLPHAIRVLGSSFCNISRNQIRLKEWTKHANHQGIVLDQITVNSTAYTPAGNLVSENVIEDVTSGIVEGTSGINRFHTNIFNNVTTEYVGVTSTVSWDDTGAIYVDATNAANVGSGEDDLIAVDLPANSFKSGLNRAVKVRAWGTAANNSNAKTLKFYFGTTQVLSVSLTANQANTWSIDALIVGSSTSQKVCADFVQEGSTDIVSTHVANATETASSAITIKCTGEGVSDSDITQNALVVEVT